MKDQVPSIFTELINNFLFKIISCFMRLLILMEQILTMQLLTLKIMQQKRVPSLSLNFLIATISCVSCKIKAMKWKWARFVGHFLLPFSPLSIRRRKKQASKKNFTLQKVNWKPGKYLGDQAKCSTNPHTADMSQLGSPVQKQQS